MSTQHKKWVDIVQKKLNEKGWNKSELAIVVGVTPAAITRVLKDGQGSDALKLEINRKLGITESWTSFKEGA